jgi:hypothetical protein
MRSAIPGAQAYGLTRARILRILAPLPAWATVLLTLGSTAIGATAALTASWIQLRSARRDRERTEAAARQARGGAVIGPILGVLDDLEPSAIASSGGRSQETIANIGRRWWKARDELLVFGATDSSGGVALAANSLADAVAATWTSVVRLNQEPGSAAGLQTAVTNHGEARRAADRLGELLRRVDRSPG